MLQYTHASVQDFTQVCELFLVLFSIISIYHNSVVTVEEEEDDVSLRKVADKLVKKKLKVRPRPSGENR